MWRLYLASPLLGETNAEHAQHVAVCRLHLHMSLNQSLPLAYQTAQFVCGEVHALYRSIKLTSAYSPIICSQAAAVAAFSRCIAGCMLLTTTFMGLQYTLNYCC